MSETFKNRSFVKDNQILTILMMKDFTMSDISNAGNGPLIYLIVNICTAVVDITHLFSLNWFGGVAEALLGL